MLKAEELGSALAMPISSLSLAAASPPQSLRMAFEEVSPRMEPFPGVAMEIQQVHPLLHGLQDSLHAETDRDRLILGSFSCKRVKVIAIILSCKGSSPLGAGNSDQGPAGCCSDGLGPSWEIWVWGLLCLRWKQQRMFSMLRNVSLQLKHPLSPQGCPAQVLGSPPSVPHYLPPGPQLHLGLSCCQPGVQPVGRP